MDTKKCAHCVIRDAEQGRRFCDLCAGCLTLDQKLKATKQGPYSPARKLGELAPELTAVLIALLNRPQSADAQESARKMIKKADATGYFSYAVSNNGGK